jgi:catalase
VAVADNQSSLKAGLRGPALLEGLHPAREDHPLRPRAHPRAHRARARLGAHGYFECYEPLTASPARRRSRRRASDAGVRALLDRGRRARLADTARDARGFAVKFYTDEGNWDLVGNNIPVFFIQDAMKFPDLVHAVKPEPHHGMPQAARRTTPSGTSSRSCPSPRTC